MNKANIEDIYPLSAVQKALLFHKVTSESDEGNLHIQIHFRGTLDRDKCIRAWQRTAKRHFALRSSVHWKGMNKPVQVVRRHIDIPIAFESLEGLVQEASDLRLKELIQEDVDLGLEIDDVPVFRLRFITLAANEHVLLWSCHHILLDGWSSLIILKDFLAYYDNEFHRNGTIPDNLPSYKTYLNWVKSKDPEKDRIFWQKEFALCSYNPVFDLNKIDQGLRVYDFFIPDEVTKSTKSLMSNQRLTLGPIIHLTWSLLLAGMGDSNDVVFGLTTSGRNAEIPNIHLLSGLFINVLPIRTVFSKNEPTHQLLEQIQITSVERAKHDHNSLSQIAQWLNDDGLNLTLDTLLTIENLPSKDLSGQHLQIVEYIGDVTTNYPLSIIVIPGEIIKIKAYFDQAHINRLTIEKIGEQFVDALGRVCQNEGVLDIIKDLRLHLGEVTTSQPKSKSPKSSNYEAPQNASELALNRIWEELLGVQTIGVLDNFFALGGKSIHAIRLFTRIEQEMGIALSPNMLLEAPTIRELAKRLGTEKEYDIKTTSLIPLRSRGNQPALFCIHAGRGHIFFYKGLSDSLAHTQPVYAIQPLDESGQSRQFASIENMALQYWKDMQTIQPDGPYYLLGYCFSNPVCLEIAKLIKNEKGDEVHIIVVDSAPPRPVKTDSGNKLIKLIQIVRHGNWDRLGFILNEKLTSITSRFPSFMQNTEKHKLRAIRDNLRLIYSKYNWTGYEGKVTLIRSSQFEKRKDKDFHVEEWSRIASEGLEVSVIDGTHAGLFIEPQVRDLAEQVGKVLSSHNDR